MMCMNHIKNNMKYTNTLCRTLLCIFFVDGCDPRTSYSVLITTQKLCENIMI